MLLANLTKSDLMERLITLKRGVPANDLSTSPFAMDQLLDLFVRGANRSWNPSADFDYLAYIFADLAKHRAGRAYLTTAQTYDDVRPLQKLLPFTDMVTAPLARRLGVAAALKNVSFSTELHRVLLLPPLAVLPYVLLPLASGADQYSEREQDEMLEDLQLLDDGVKREADVQVLKTHLDTTLLLCTEREGREVVRASGAYYVIRECHAAVEDEDVREGCDRLVQVLMRDEAPEEARSGTGKMLENRDGGAVARDAASDTNGKFMDGSDDSEDDKIVDVI